MSQTGKSTTLWLVNHRTMAGPWLPNGFNFHRGLNPRKPNFAALPDLPVLWTLAMDYGHDFSGHMRKEKHQLFRGSPFSDTSGFQSRGDTPIAGWFTMEHRIKLDDLGVPPWLRNPPSWYTIPNILGQPIGRNINWRLWNCCFSLSLMLKSYEFPMCDCYIPICEWYYHHVFLGNPKNVQLNYHFIPRYISTIPVLKRTKIHSQFIMIMIALYQVYIYDLYIISCILIYSLCNRYISIYI